MAARLVFSLQGVNHKPSAMLAQIHIVPIFTTVLGLLTGLGFVCALATFIGDRLLQAYFSKTNLKPVRVRARAPQMKPDRADV